MFKNGSRLSIVVLFDNGVEKEFNYHDKNLSKEEMESEVKKLLDATKVFYSESDPNKGGNIRIGNSVINLARTSSVSFSITN